MAQASIKSSSVVRFGRLDIGLVVFSIVALAVLVRLLVTIVPEAFELHFNSYALISLAGLALNLSLLIILIRRYDHSESNVWFALFIIVGVLWSESEAMERMSTTPIGGAFWGDIISGVVCLMPVFFYLFVRSYTNRSQVHIPLWVPAGLIGAGLTMMALFSANNVFEIPAVSERLPWGYLGPMSTVSVIYIIWAAALTICAIVRLISFSRNSKSVQDRRQALIFIVSSAAVLVVSAVTEIILPMLGFNSIPPLGVLTNSLLALCVIIGIYKYGSFSVGIDEIAETVLATMADGVIVTDAAYNILFRNDMAQKQLSAIGKDLIGVNLTTTYANRFEEARIKWENDLATSGYANSQDIEIGSPTDRAIVNLHVTPIGTKQPGYVFVLIDVTKARNAADVLAKQSSKLADSNKAFQDSQAAMLNLLEDARELELELKNEKASVEQKVVERTSQLQAQRESLAAIINGVDFGIYTLDADLHMDLVNKAMQDMYARAYDKPYTLEAFDANVHSQADSQADIQEAIKTHLAVKREEFARGNLMLRAFRSPIFESGTGKPKLVGVVNVVQDITEAKAAERSRDEFFSIASHELRTPLTAIRGNTSMIQDYFSEAIKDPSLKEMISDIHDSSIRLISIVNDFLDTSRLEQGKIEFKIESVDLVDLVAEVIKEFKAGDTNAKIPITLNESTVPNVMADRDRLKEVIINLISNAVKFTDDGSISVDLSSDDNKVRLSVTDTGRGIPAESQGLLFHKFQQASNNILTRDSTRSTGLGLYISKLIMVGMGGEIFLEKSAADEGAVFVVTLPTVDPTDKSREPKPGQNEEHS